MLYCNTVRRQESNWCDIVSLTQELCRAESFDVDLKTEWQICSTLLDKTYKLDNWVACRGVNAMPPSPKSQSWLTRAPWNRVSSLNALFVAIKSLVWLSQNGSIGTWLMKLDQSILINWAPALLLGYRIENACPYNVLWICWMLWRAKLQDRGLEGKCDLNQSCETKMTNRAVLSQGCCMVRLVSKKSGTAIWLTSSAPVLTDVSCKLSLAYSLNLSC